MHQNGYIGRKMRQPLLQEQPAIIFTAFGSSSRAKAALTNFTEKVEEKYSGYTQLWAYSSEIIRKKECTASLHQALAEAEALGYRKVVVQPLHIFPGTEYQQIAETCEYFPGLRVFLSETLMHRWDFIEEVLEIVEEEFLGDDQGLNLLALHGTPLAADPVNIVYMGIDRLVRDLYENVVTACVEGIPNFQGCLQRIKRENLHHRYSRLKIIPLMYLAGIHVEDDLMGDDDSWRLELENLGLEVECALTTYKDNKYFKGLGFYPAITDLLMKRLDRTLSLATVY